MQPWFMWRGKDSRDMGLWITKYPAITRAEERAERLKIPGRAGHMTMIEGEDVYDGYLRECVVTAPYTADFQALTSWLRGEGLVVFGNEDSRAYEAHIAGKVAFDLDGNSFRQATIPFYVQPYKRQFPQETEISRSGESSTITNPGDVESRPIVTVTYTGNIEITIGGHTLAFTGLASDAPITVDCGAEIITNADGTIWQGTYSGEFWRIPTGISTITMSAAGCTLFIKPEWRWV